MREALRQYLEAQREFNVVLERCSLKGWPDKKAALRVTLRVQELFCEREALRLNHLLQDCARDNAAWESYTSISKVRERLEDGWNDDDEEALGTGTFRSYSAYGNGAVG